MALSPALRKLVQWPREKRYQEALLDEAEGLQIRASRLREEADDLECVANLLFAEHYKLAG